MSPPHAGGTLRELTHLLERRNYPEYIISFFAAASIGAVATCVNAFSPKDVLAYCITSTTCKVIIIDGEKATLLSPLLSKLEAAGSKAVLVVRSKNAVPAGMIDYNSALARFAGKTTLPKIDILPEDNAVIFFTSGYVHPLIAHKKC